MSISKWVVRCMVLAAIIAIVIGGWMHRKSTEVTDPIRRKVSRPTKESILDSIKQIYYLGFDKFTPKDSVVEIDGYKNHVLWFKRMLKPAPNPVWAFYRFMKDTNEIMAVYFRGRIRKGRINAPNKYTRIVAEEGDWTASGDLVVDGRHGAIWGQGDPNVIQKLVTHKTKDSNKEADLFAGVNIWID